MKTECKTTQIKFQDLGRRKIIGEFNGGNITSDGGGLILREIDQKFDILKKFARCFTDKRNQKRIKHTVEELLSQRIYGIALGYEDLNDHDVLRADPLLAVLCGKNNPTGTNYNDKPLAGKSTLNRLETAEPGEEKKNRYKKITADTYKIDDFFVDIFLESHLKEPEQIIIDVDATDDPLHGNQEGRFFHAYYKNYCYLPLYIFCEKHLLCARLRPSNIDASKGTKNELERIITRIRRYWKNVRIIIRCDSGFCREELMVWCEENNIDFILGMAKNDRLNTIIKEDLIDAQIMFVKTGRPARIFNDFFYKTLKSWSKERRVIGKAEYLSRGSNPRYIVTSIKDTDADVLYEKIYCARGEMENRIKEQQLYLFADRTSTKKMVSNQLRLYFSSVAYVLINALRHFGLKRTQFAKAQCHTIRLKLFKIGSQIRVTVRKVWFAFVGGYPYKNIFRQIFDNIKNIKYCPG